MATINVLDRFWQPASEVLTPEIAQTIVSFKPDDEVAARVAELGRKSNDGTLTDDERAE